MIIQQPQATTITDPHEERLRIQTERLIAYRDDGPLVAVLKGVFGRGVSPDRKSTRLNSSHWE